MIAPMLLQSVTTVLLFCLLFTLVVLLRLRKWRESYHRATRFIRQQENQIAELKLKLVDSHKAIYDGKAELLLLREVTSILRQTHDFGLSLRSAFSKMLDLLSIDFGVICLGEKARHDFKISNGISEDFLETLHKVSERRVVLEENPRPLQTYYFEDFQRSRHLQAMERACSLLTLACKVKSNFVGYFIVGFHKRHIYSQSELDALQFCADQFASSYQISKQLLDIQEIARLQHDYISNVSHELRTPLSTIYGYLNILKSYPESLFQGQEKTEMFSVMTDECQRLIRLINNLLLSAQVEQEGFAQKTNRVPISLGQIVSQALRFMDRELKSKEIQVAAIIPESLPRIEGNSDLLYQVFQNLIGNSIKFCSKDPKIEIAAREEDQAVVIYFRDNGVGIDRKDLRKIFQKFYRSHTEASKQPGLGIGLYLVQKLVHLHEGEIYVTSEPNQGTTFILKFPKVDRPKALAEQSSNSAVERDR